MIILLGCEESQAVCKEFRKLGHEAYSCDELPCSGGHPEWHIQYDVLQIIKRTEFLTQDNVLHIIKGWDMAIFFPPCTHLAVSGAKHFEQKRKDGRQQQGIDFFMALQNTDIPMTATENPVGIMSTIYRKPDQIIQPYEFGEEASKKTCLWLKNLPLLFPTQIVQPQITTLKTGAKFSTWDYKISMNHKERAKLRSKTFPGIAQAMASQWSNPNNFNMKQEVKKDYVRVIPQITFKPNVVSLISEENHKYYPKGSIVLQVSRDTVYAMHHPLVCEVKKIKSKGVEKYVAKVVLQGEFTE